MSRCQWADFSGSTGAAFNVSRAEASLRRLHQLRSWCTRHMMPNARHGCASIEKRLSTAPSSMGWGPSSPVERTQPCSAVLVTSSWKKSHESQVKVFMLSITIVSLGPSGVLKALQLEHKNWRTIVEPESRSRPAASLHGMNVGSCHEEWCTSCLATFHMDPHAATTLTTLRQGLQLFEGLLVPAVYSTTWVKSGKWKPAETQHGESVEPPDAPEAPRWDSRHRWIFRLEWVTSVTWMFAGFRLTNMETLNGISLTGWPEIWIQMVQIVPNTLISIHW